MGSTTSVNCCPNCNQYEKYPGTDFCCRTCRNSPGSHGGGCQKIPCGGGQQSQYQQSQYQQSQYQQSSTNCCPKCNTYKKNSPYDFCCLSCRDSNGKYHGQGCTKDPCIGGRQSVSQYQQSSINCCPKCNTYKKNSPYDFCCLSCRDSNGKYHGNSCTKDPCIGGRQPVSQYQSSSVDPCKNLINGSYLYDPNATICFYDKNNAYYEFTNVYPSQITINNISYPSVEHYYQSQKFDGNSQLQSIIRSQPTGRAAQQEAQKYTIPNANYWHTSRKFDVMREGIIAKIQQHPNVRQMLINTVNKKLVEHTINDKEWGDGGDGTGNNALGGILMEIRAGINQGAYGGNINNEKRYIRFKNIK